VRDESDEVLVRRVMSGETLAYEELVRRYRLQLGRYATRMLGNVADAEDALQDTLVRGYRSLGHCDPRRFRNWIFGILINRCRTYAAQRARRQEALASSAHEIDSATLHTTEEHEWRQVIGWALAQLPAEQREAFLLKHVEDLSYDEMQELTGARVPALKMRVLRAREALRRLLEEKVVG
jgi:RNA polymerase sigma-70 factor (ECF subfamily)